MKIKGPKTKSVTKIVGHVILCYAITPVNATAV
jgi:hypothetical protein